MRKNEKLYIQTNELSNENTKRRVKFASMYISREITDWYGTFPRNARQPWSVGIRYDTRECTWPTGRGQSKGGLGVKGPGNGQYELNSDYKNK